MPFGSKHCSHDQMRFVLPLDPVGSRERLIPSQHHFEQQKLILSKPVGTTVGILNRSSRCLLMLPCRPTPKSPSRPVFHLGHVFLCFYPHECAVVCICELEHTYQCVSRLQEYWSLSRTHFTAAGDRATCIMPQSGLSVPAAHSHARSRANLRRGDIWLHQQVGRSHFRHVLSALRRLRSLRNPPRRRPTSPTRRDSGFASNFGGRRQSRRAVAAARLTSASLSRSFGRSTA